MADTSHDENASRAAATRHHSPLGQAAQEQGIVLAQMLIVADIEQVGQTSPAEPRS